VDRWRLRWCEHSTGGRLDDRNLAGEDTQAWSRVGLGEDSPDRWVPSDSDELTRGDGLGSVTSWAGRGENGP
jgi:hypothetical protein